MRAVAVGVSRRAELSGLIHLPVGGLVSAGEPPGADEFPVAGSGRKILSGDALSPPFGGNGAEVAVVEALALRPDSGVDNSDDEIRAEIGLVEQAGPVGGS